MSAGRVASCQAPAGQQAGVAAGGGRAAGSEGAGAGPRWAPITMRSLRAEFRTRAALGHSSTASRRRGRAREARAGPDWFSTDSSGTADAGGSRRGQVARAAARAPCVVRWIACLAIGHNDQASQHPGAAPWAPLRAFGGDSRNSPVAPVFRAPGPPNPRISDNTVLPRVPGP